MMGHHALPQFLSEVFHPDGTHIIGPAKYAPYILIVSVLIAGHEERHIYLFSFSFCRFNMDFCLFRHMKDCIPAEISK
jgi:hypothetical protein